MSNEAARVTVSDASPTHTLRSEVERELQRQAEREDRPGWGYIWFGIGLLWFSLLWLVL